MTSDAPNWKPEACADCGAPHPAWSLTGPTGPWRCYTCNTAAAHVEPPQPNPPAPHKEGLLL